MHMHVHVGDMHVHVGDVSADQFQQRFGMYHGL